MLLAAALGLGLLVPTARADDISSELDVLRRTVEELRREQEERNRRLDLLLVRLDDLERRAASFPAPSPEGAPEPAARSAPVRARADEAPPEGPPRSRTPQEDLDEAIRALPRPDAPATPEIASVRLGGATLRLLDVSLDILVAAGTSTARDAELEALQGGGHDPRKRGFTLQNVELSFLGAVDPYFLAEAHLITFIDPFEGETVVELEEAFLTTQFLPCGFELEVGHFFTEFGRLNPRHPHAWDFLDQPVALTRLFGPDGMRGTGARLGWLLPVPWFAQLHVGVQNAAGETMASFLASDEFFEERAIGGRPFVDREVHALRDLAWHVRLETSAELGCDVTALLGLSSLLGPNATGPDGSTWIGGADLLLRWRPAGGEKGWPFLSWQTEVLGRRYVADAFFDEGDPLDPLDDLDLPRAVLRDGGLYSQVLWGFEPRWVAGLRYEHATGSGASFDLDAGAPLSRRRDPWRDDRHRIAFLLAHHLTEFSRIRLQYNLDTADHLDREAHSFWLGFEVLLGSHPVHRY